LFDFDTLTSKVDKYKDYAVMTAPGYSSPGLFRIVQRLLGRDAFLDVMMFHPKFFARLTEKINEFYLSFIEKLFEKANGGIDFIRIADDFGSQSGLNITNEIWEQYCKPTIDAYTQIPKAIGVKFYMHSCGGVRKLLPEFISLGADVLDPIQTRANGMEPNGLKEDFGNYITFCGALDEELVLRQGTPQQVKDGVNQLLDTMAPGGGFILGPSHKLKVETPVENVLAMYEAAKAWKY
jgi:uroporphyrinogen decarboxylase